MTIEKLKSIVAEMLKTDPTKISEYLASLGIKIADNENEVWEAIKQQAFTVAKILSADVLELLRSEMIIAQEKGTPFAEFKKNIKPKLQDAGFARKSDGSAWRLDTIVRTNSQTAYMQGCYNEMKQAQKELPYWQFVADIDSRTTEGCRALDGKVFPADDPIWNTNFPPRHYNCRSTVIALGDEQLKRFKLKVSNSDNYKNIKPAKGFDKKPIDPWTPDLSKYSPELKNELKAIL